MKKDICEADMYLPICEYLKEQGYSVYSEVKNCDVTAVKGDELIVIEMKKSMNISLLIQATNRQKAADSVYVAIPLLNNRRKIKNWNGICYLLRRLELGLITVSFNSHMKGKVEVAFHPSQFKRVTNKKMRNSIIREISGRSGDYNVGGSCRSKLVTAYREMCIYIACCFEKFGPLSPAQLRRLGAGPKTTSILSKNYYGWFERTKRGVYNLHPNAYDCLKTYSSIAENCRKRLDEINEIPKNNNVSRTNMTVR